MKDACRGEPPTVARVPSLAGASARTTRSASPRRSNMSDNESASIRQFRRASRIGRRSPFVQTKDSRASCEQAATSRRVTSAHEHICLVSCYVLCPLVSWEVPLRHPPIGGPVARGDSVVPASLRAHGGAMCTKSTICQARPQGASMALLNEINRLHPDRQVGILTLHRKYVPVIFNLALTQSNANLRQQRNSGMRYFVFVLWPGSFGTTSHRFLERLPSLGGSREHQGGTNSTRITGARENRAPLTEPSTA
jgi:hypothetical protein